MADKLTLRGVKRIENYVEPAATGDRVFSLKRPTTGKDQFTLKRWWTEQGARIPKRYVNATCLDGTFNGTAVVLAVVSTQDTRLEINLNDAGTDLVFGETHSVERIAIFSADLGTLHYDYIIPKIPGVAPAQLTINAITAATTIGTVTLSGEQSPADGATETYTVSRSGDASPTYVLTSSDAADVISGLDVTFTGSGARTLTATATDAGASDSPATGTLSINVPVFFAARVASADLSVAVTVADTGNGNKYQIDGVEQDAIVATAGSTIHFDLSDASLSGHPFGIYTDSSKTTQVTVGLEQEGTDLLFTPPIAGNFSYQCGSHANMGGDITVTN